MSRIGQRVIVDFSIYNRLPDDDSPADIDYIGHSRDGGYRCNLRASDSVAA